MVSLLLSCMTLSFTTSRRFIPTLSRLKARPTLTRNYRIFRMAASITDSSVSPTNDFTSLPCLS